MPIQMASRQILGRAAEILGGAEVLASRLAISAGVLKLYLEGNEEIPTSVLLPAMDIILEDLRQSPTTWQDPSRPES